MSHILHAGIFAGGLCLGAAASAAIVSSKRMVPEPTTTASSAALPPTTVGTPLTVVGSNSASAIPFFSRDILKYSPGVPGPVVDLLEHEAYVTAYDRKLRHPAWAAEHITAASLVMPPAVPGQPAPVPVNRKFSVFKEDERIPELFRAKLADYFRSGYDRGHMVPAADAKRSQNAMNETFLLSNIAPQVGEGFNRDYWAGTEDFVRLLTRRFSDLYVFTIPLYLPQPDPERPGKWKVQYEVIGNPPNIGVPTHFAKVILAVGGPKPELPTRSGSAPAPLPGTGGAGTSFLGLRSGSSVTALAAFVMPNAAIPNEVPLTQFLVPVESVERAAGITLFPPAIRTGSKSLCDLVDCKIIVRDFSEQNKRIASGTRSAPPSQPLPIPGK